MVDEWERAAKLGRLMPESRPLDDAIVKTYLYLRVGLVAAVMLLGIAVALQIKAGGMEDSISAFYYTPVQPVFVGVLVGAALALVAIRGRHGWEDVMLDLAAMLMMVVAFIPTTTTPDEPCPNREGQAPPEKCIPREYRDDVELSLQALVWLGAVVLIFAAWTVHKSRQVEDRAAKIGLALAIFGWLSLFIMRVVDEATWLLTYGHTLAAIMMFWLIVLVAIINKRALQNAQDGAGRKTLLITYSIIAWGMTLVILLAILVWLLWAKDQEKSTFLFWVEAILLCLFAIFWIAQTVQFYHEGLPEGALDGASDS